MLRSMDTTTSPPAANRGRSRFWAWLTNDERFRECAAGGDDNVDWLRSIPFWLFHLGCAGVIWTGVSTAAVMFALSAYFVRMFFITAFYHRYFAHRTFSASRSVQFLFAVLGCTAGQRGPLWWAAHHRQHHGHADTPSDPHSPLHRGFLFSHTLWFLTPSTFSPPKRYIKDWRRYPELVALERLDWVPFILFGVFCCGVGHWLGAAYDTSGMQFLVWGFFISTTVLYHATYTINSLAHVYGSRRFDTGDESRNNPWLALLTLGEGWHNNHHRYPAAARQGFYWWEIDVSYSLLRLLSAVLVIGELRPVPESVLAEGRSSRVAGRR
jgi:stearoyl-CoA desaturase (Delta-9 desaturase)